jgi:uncharacterized membrane protein YgcG
VGVSLVAVLALGACSASGSGGSSSGAGVPAIAPANPEVGDAAAPDASGSAPDAAADAQKLAESAAGSGTAARSSSPSSAADIAAADKLVRTASLQVQVDDVESKAAQARQVAIAAGGMVLSENSSAVPDSSGGVDKQGSRSTLSLAVPADTLDRVLDDLGKLGTTVQRSSTARDVTASYVDTQSRVATMKAGVDQLRTLLAKTSELSQIVSLETEISRRQADLDSLQAQLNALDKKVAMSTVGLTLVTAANVVVPDEEPSGFVGGLRSGWKAFLGASSGVLTVLGAVLPFLVLAAIVAVPVLWWRRRRTGDATPSVGNAGGPQGSEGAGGSGGSGGNGDGGGSDDGGKPSGGPAPGTSRSSIPSETGEGSEGLDGGSVAQPDEGRRTGQREPETAGVGPR